VEEKSFSAAAKQLEAYFSENRNWPPPKPKTNRFDAGETPPTFLMMTCLALFHWITGPWQQNNLWFEKGAINSNAIIHHQQWWRLFTSLSLHADQLHLISNIVIGGFLVHLLCRSIGYGTGWLVIILTGALGNLVNIAFRTIEHHSVGFSTAIFSAIGISCGLQLRLKNPSVKQLLLPLGAGISLLALLGTEGERTDLGAHFFGFTCGIISGILIRKFNISQYTVRPLIQSVLFFLALFILLTSWWLALKSV